MRDRITALLERPERWLCAVPVMVAAALAFRRLDDADTWWHLAGGRWVARHGTVPATDPFSFTVPEHAWVNLQWLYDLALYGLFQIGGADLLVVAAAAAYAAAVWLLTRNLRLFLAPAGAAALALAAVLVAEERFFIRPEMVSFLLLQAVLWLLLTARAGDGRRLWLLVPLMLLWVNCHSLFVLGLFAIGSAAASALLARTPILPPGWRAASRLGPLATRRLVLAGAGALAVTLANPYGLEGARFPLRLLTRIDPSDPFFQAIAEFRPPFSGFLPTVALAVYQAFFVVSVAVVVLAAAVSVGRPRPAGKRSAPTAPAVDLATLIMFAGFAYLSVLARRNTAIFVLGAAPLTACCLAVVGRRMPARLHRAGRAARPVLAGALVAASVALTLGAVTNRYYRWAGIAHEFGPGILAGNFPIRAAAFAAQVGLRPNLYNDLTAGGYLTWAAPVGAGVFIDGRLEVYERDFFASYIRGMVDPGHWQREADRWKVESVLVFHRWGSRQQLVSSLLRSPQWALLYYDETAIIFVRTPGNEGVVARARRLFPEWQRQTLRALDGPAPRWRWPAGRVEALEGYGRILFMVGAGTRGVEMYERLLAIGVDSQREVRVRYELGRHFARSGNGERARAELRRAAALDPASARVRNLLGQIGG